MKAVNYITQFLKSKNIDVIFDYPGNAVIPLYEALCGSGIRHYTVRHEQGAVHAAEGYAKSGGKIGVCLATSGPGATNLVTGLCDAMLDSVPLIAITGQVDRSAIGHDAFQEADIMGITLAVTKHNFLVKETSDLPTVLEEAWLIATSGRKGPVLIDIPHDILDGELPDDSLPHPILPHSRSYKNNLASQKQKTRRLIEKSARPVIICGGGVVSAGDRATLALEALTKRLSIPVVYTMMGKSGIDNTLPSVFGMLGLHGTEAANSIIDESDTLIAVGCRFSDRSCPNPIHFSDDKVIIHADIDAAELCKNVYSVCPIVTDAAEFLEFLLGCSFSEKAIARWQSRLASLSHFDKCTDGIFSARTAISALSKLAPDAIYITDVGKHQLFAAENCIVRRPGSFICSGGLGTMGFGLPAAIGAAIANPTRQIILITGDGSLQMCLQELATIRSGKLNNIKIFLIDNSSLGLVEQLYEKIYPGEGIPFNISFNPDFSLIADAYGIAYYDIKSFSDISDALRDNSSALLRVVAAKSENAPLFDGLKGVSDETHNSSDS